MSFLFAYLAIGALFAMWQHASNVQPHSEYHSPLLAAVFWPVIVLVLGLAIVTDMFREEL